MSLNFPIVNSVFSTQVEPELCKITNQEVFFQVLVLIFRSVNFNFNHFEFVAAILEKGTRSIVFCNFCFTILDHAATK